MEPVLTMSDEMMRCLREPFPEKEVQTKPGQGGLKYISHGSVTNRLLKCDPLYNYDIVEEHRTPDGKNCIGVTMALTIGGITRTEVGGPQRLGQSIIADLKNARSDALKRCAMRFGVALEMWEDLIDAEGDEDNAPRNATRPVAPSNPVKDTSRPVTPRSERVDPVAPTQDGDYNWQDFWTWARSQQLGTPQAIEAVIGRSINGMSPNQIRDTIVVNTADPNAPQPAKTTTSKQDPEDPNSILPTKRREAFIGSIFEHTKGQITATDLNNLIQEKHGKSLQRVTVGESRIVYNHILNAVDYVLIAERDELRRKYQPITGAQRKKLFAISAEKCPTDIYDQGKDAADNFLHVQLFEHLGLGSVKDMSTYDVDKMVSVYEAGNFLDAVTA